MRNFSAFCLIALVAAVPAYAQSTGSTAPNPVTSRAHVTHTGVTPLDHGPFTVEANRAYEGGGMILQGAPGAPPPLPQATPPGQTPRNIVPQ